jgi:iron complex outermembrane receptor protein
LPAFAQVTIRRGMRRFKSRELAGMMIIKSTRSTVLPFRRAALCLAVVSASACLPHTALAQDIQEISVFGQGETRQVQSLGALELESFAAGTSPLKAIEKLPGVNFQSADPYGAYEWSTRIVVRGFNQNQMGFTLDGIPLGDMSYANHNGLHISRAIMSENMGRVTLSQGAGALSTASTSNLGGTLEFASAAPQDDFGLQANGSVGSENSQRIFLRLDSGALSSGTRLFVSAATQDTDKWKGAGKQQQEYLNAKLTQELGGGEVTAYYSHSDRAENDYQDMSKDMIRRLGSNWDNYFPDWDRAVAAARGQFSGNVNSLDDAYWHAAGLRQDDLGYLKLALPIGSSANWSTTIYKHTNEGQGLWGTPYVPTPGGAPLTVRTTEYEIDRQGLISSLNFEIGTHNLEVGVWTEDNDFQQARRFYGEPDATAPTRSFLKFQSNPLLTQWEYLFNTKTTQLYVKDTWQSTDRLRLEYGFKSVNVDVKAQTLTGDNKTGSIKTDEKFLPQAGFVYDLNDRAELFGAASQNVRALIGSATGTSPFSASQAGFEQIRDTIKPETATTFELGLRFRDDVLEGVVSAYHVKFNDRLLAIQQGSAIIGAFNALANVGSVTSRGIETGVDWQLHPLVNWYNSASFNESTYDDDFTSGTTLVRTKGKTVVDSPRWMFNSELGFDNENTFAKLHLKYTSAREYTFLNQGNVDGYSIMNLSAGYRFGQVGALRDLTAQLDVTNLLDKDYISTVGSGGFGNADANGTAQTLLPAAPRQLFLSLKASF